MSTIRFQCPYCFVTLKIPAAAAGRRGKCTSCGQRINIPADVAPADRRQPADARSESAPFSLTDSADTDEPDDEVFTFSDSFFEPPASGREESPQRAPMPPIQISATDQFAPAPPKSTEPRKAPAAAVSASHLRLVIGLLTALLAAQLFGLTSTKTSTTTWEYKLESPSDITFESEMQRFGSDGWELVFARRATSEYSSTASYEMIFKRPKQH